jgi:hypothetical protein
MTVRRKIANLVAAIVAGIVLVGGAITMAAVGIEFVPPQKTTTVLENSHGGGVGKRAKVVERNHTDGPEGKASESGGSEIKRSGSTEVPIARPATKRTVTEEDGSRSFFERIGGKAGQILLLAGVLILAAFLAGAFVQRLLLGDFSIKLGSMLDLGTVEEAKEETTLKLTAEVEKLKGDVAKGLASVEKQQKDIEAATTKVAAIADSQVVIGEAVKVMLGQITELQTQSKGGATNE